LSLKHENAPSSKKDDCVGNMSSPQLQNVDLLPLLDDAIFNFLVKL